MFPWTSIDGFSVVDYRQVDPHLGQWSDIAALAGDFNLMFDFVINHISQQSRWFGAICMVSLATRTTLSTPIRMKITADHTSAYISFINAIHA